MLVALLECEKLYVKVIGDTLRLSEHSNQMFVYGNFIPNSFEVTTIIKKYSRATSHKRKT